MSSSIQYLVRIYVETVGSVSDLGMEFVACHWYSRQGDVVAPGVWRTRIFSYGPSRQCVTDDIVTDARTVRPRVRCIDPPALAAAILAVRMSSRQMGYEVRTRRRTRYGIQVNDGVKSLVRVS